MPRVSRILMIVLVFALFFPFTTNLSVAHAAEKEASTTYEYTAIGDSIGFGFGAFHGYVPRYGDYMEDDTSSKVNIQNKSVLGWETPQLLHAVKTDTAMRLRLAVSSVISWDIGGNDFRVARNKYIAGTCGGPKNEDCLVETSKLVKKNWIEIVTILHELRQGKDTNFRTMDLYNPYIAVDKKAKSYDGTKSRFEVFKPYLDDLNQFIHDQESMGYTTANVYDAFNGPKHDEDPRAKGYIFIDGLHPNYKGYEVIAKEFRKLGYAPLVP
ncbi:SGNH/GDSL hydrolase family protein [Marininema halotolerans]|uniref:Lysophospholipase L1 n=1 Tax=Marininema halotolerans TaxID=1155944 RepID=A0A1I6TR97_9BACL|nr:SGNH/GDSL hydrolase family protein [Marininema halotolerans]SFS91701.1 Lysophospholipase L1 [Marininema halotolerans]